MKIIAKKKIYLKTIEIIGEVDCFSIDSPYAKLLKDIKTFEAFEKKFDDCNNEYLIENCKLQFEKLGILSKDGKIKDLNKGFPNRGYGKYEIQYYENDVEIPFKYKIVDICPIKAENTFNTEVRQLNKHLVDFLEKEGQNNKYKIYKVENSLGLSKSQKVVVMEIIYEKGNWSYKIKKETSKMNRLDLSYFFYNPWKEDKLEVPFNLSKFKKDDYLKFTISNFIKSAQIIPYGYFENISYSDIPIVPSDKDNFKQWFKLLICEELFSKETYIGEEDLIQLQLKILRDSLQFAPYIDFKCFDFSEILDFVKENPKTYWLLKTVADLNPFDKKELSQDNQSYIEPIKNCELNSVFRNYLSRGSKVTIIDRYINTKHNYEGLFALIEAFDLEVMIFTTDYYLPKMIKSDYEILENQIDEKLNSLKMKRTIYKKNLLPHDRYWKVDNKIYHVSKSIDFINVKNNEIDIEGVHMDEKNISNIDPQAKELLSNGKNSTN